MQSGSASIMTAPVHILLVDDDPAENVILRALMRKVTSYAITLHYVETVEAALDFIRAASAPLDMILMDNRLQPQADFRQTVPELRRNGYIGPVGVISSSISDAYFQKIDDYGVDFRIDKAELDPTAIEFILQEYVRRDASAGI
jgi:DNA-binding NarL/FixJ family response regulator